MFEWTEEALSKLNVRKGFRLRGESMTRIEVFSDAAFAFAVTMLVISLSGIPGNYEELVEALKGVPAFAASFTQIMIFWAAHRSWSRRLGMDDPISTLITLGLIFVILVYVYPLRLMMTSFFSYISGGYFPSSFVVTSASEIAGLMIIYGLGVFLVAGSQWALYQRAQAAEKPLGLNAEEKQVISVEMTIWSIHAFIGLASALFCWLFQSSFGYLGGFMYFLLPLVIPLLTRKAARKHKPDSPETPSSALD